MRVLGIDPGSQSTGFGIIDHDETRYKVRAFGTIKPSRRLPFHLKLNEIARGVEEIIVAHSPDEVAIESPFYAQNIKTAIALGQVRGAVLVAVASTGRPLAEYSALEIKKAVTGYGRAEKQQVNTMVKALLNVEEEVETDASDALAAAICHLNTRMFQKSVEESAAGGKR
ncbi:MAG TPA: crossover junction endodeoxyribonuclease RuvC [Candidatus Aminicenantes bacterium]|nr:crossover junction endodeoxyribonuclease RuvC [Candidatus Aminicenantes bacterium]